MPKNTGKVSSMYTVRTDWNEVQLSNELKEHNVVQVWSFRLGQQSSDNASSSSSSQERGSLHFALVLVEKAKDSKKMHNQGIKIRYCERWNYSYFFHENFVLLYF